MTIATIGRLMKKRYMDESRTRRKILSFRGLVAESFRWPVGLIGFVPNGFGFTTVPSFDLLRALDHDAVAGFEAAFNHPIRADLLADLTD